MEKHTLEPFYNQDSQVLILGSFPSVISRKEGFYYAHPQNRFWKVLGYIYNEEISNINSKKEFLKKHNIVLYDVCKTCNIKGSQDSTIKNVEANDISIIINNSKINKIYLNGKTAYNLYNKLLKDKIDIEAIYLPSTSPANAKYKFEDLIEAYNVLKNV